VTIDAYRQEFGKAATARHRGMMSHVEIEDRGERGVVDHETPESIVVDQDGDLSYLAQHFTPTELEIAQKLVNGMTQKAVADERGVTPSRVCHLMRPVKAKIMRELRRSA
jgi:DNA-binding NarL/FixJ family response regulator